MVLHSFLWRHAGSDVKVTGEFDDWSARTSMQRTEDGHFVKVIDLPANTKVYYKFVVDGHWCVDGEGLKEGEGAHENNYVLTGAAHDTREISQDQASSGLPVLGHGASYLTTTEPGPERTLGGTIADSPDPTSTSASTVTGDYKCEIQTNLGPTKEIQTNTTGLIGIGGSSDTTATAVRPQTGLVTKELYDDSGASPSDPMAIRNARENPITHAYSGIASQLPSREEVRQEFDIVAEEVKHEFEHVAEVTGGFLTASLAAGAAMFGLSNQQSHTESAPITGATTTEPKHESASVAPAALQTIDAGVPTTTKSLDTARDEKNVSNTAATSKLSETGALEQAAVAAATSAATNAYNASGLTGLSGVGAPLSSLSKDGSVGFTGIGTAVNEKTGVVGTSKIVQGVDDPSATEDTQTAKLARDTAGSLLQHHENGAKVERINDHAVLAEVGIGGAAIGTAIVTDRTISSTNGLNIPAQAAEHLNTGSEIATSQIVADQITTTKTEDYGLAPALEHNTTVESATIVTTSTPVVIESTIVQQKSLDDPAIAVPTVPVDVAPGSNAPAAATSDTAAIGTATSVASPTPSKDVSTGATAAANSVGNTSSRPTTAATKASEATSYETAQTSAATPSQARSPSKAAAEAASKNSTMRQTLRAEPSSEAAAGSSVEQASKKKKNPFLRRMKSLFGGNKN